MYAVENVRKFVNDNADRFGDRGQGIISRAEAAAEQGVFSGGAIKEIMDDPELEREFNRAATSDPAHIRIGLDAIASVTR